MAQGLFTRFHHVTVAVRDLDTAVADWETYLGGVVSHVGVAAGARRARFAAGDAWFELAQPLDAASPLAARLADHGEGIHSVTVSVASVAEAARVARANGAILVEQPDGIVAVSPACTHDVIVELNDDAERAGGPRTWEAIHHVAIATHDMEAAAHDFERLFGGQATPTATAPDAPLKSWHYHVGDAWFGTAQTFTEDHAVARWLRERGECIYDVGVTTGDREQAAAAIVARGGRLLGSGQPGAQIFIHPRHTHGVLIELYT